MKTWASKNNRGYTVIQDATPEIISHVESHPRHGKVQANGLVLINDTAWIDLQSELKKEEDNSGVLAEVSDDDELRTEANKLNDSKAASDILINWRRKQWNHTFAGKSVAEANDLIAERGIEELYADSYYATSAKKAQANYKEAQKSFSTNQGEPRYDGFGNRIA